MGFFNVIWNFLKSVIEELIKIFYTVYDGVKYIVKCIRTLIPEIKNTWVGRIIDALSFIFDLLDFLIGQGSNLDLDNYKSKFKDLDLEKYGEHHFDLKIEEN